jgi:minor histocompatibility antigen H13
MLSLLLNVSNVLLLGFWLISYFYPIPVPLNMIVSATTIVIIGSIRSLRLLIAEEHGGLSKNEKETLSADDAYKFPLIGSAALFGLYLVFKNFDKDTINLLLSVYFSLVGVGTLTSFLSKLFPSGKNATRYGFKRTVPLLGEIDMLFSGLEFLYLLAAIAFSVAYFQTKHYMLNNIFGIVFCVHALERISIGSYKIGAILLVGLFFYDIFWVFGTDVMVTVAKSFDGPIKLLFPIKLPTAGAKGEFSLLGLGDIVVPGMFIALLLRFDAVRNKVIVMDGSIPKFSATYFLVNVASYALGLIATVFVMYYFKAAQPALLYLVPACLGGSLVVALSRAEFNLLFAYDEEAKVKAEEAKKES